MPGHRLLVNGSFSETGVKCIYKAPVPRCATHPLKGYLRKHAGRQPQFIQRDCLPWITLKQGWGKQEISSVQTQPHKPQNQHYMILGIDFLSSDCKDFYFFLSSNIVSNNIFLGLSVTQNCIKINRRHVQNFYTMENSMKKYFFWTKN